MPKSACVAAALLAIPDARVLRCVSQVMDTCLGYGVPVAGFVGGGYHADLPTLARRHTLLHRAAAELWQSLRL